MELEPACERIEKAGSVRRAKDTVGDIEFVIIPRLCPELPAQISLFDEPPTMVSALDMLLEKMVRETQTNPIEFTPPPPEHPTRN